MLKPKLISETTVIDEDHPMLSRVDRLWEWDDGGITKSSHYAHHEESAINLNGKAFNGNGNAVLVALVIGAGILIGATGKALGVL
jgi:hypothetical protein